MMFLYRVGALITSFDASISIFNLLEISSSSEGLLGFIFQPHVNVLRVVTLVFSE